MPKTSSTSASLAGSITVPSNDIAVTTTIGTGTIPHTESFEVIDAAYLPEEELNLLQKPYEARDLLRRLRELLDG